MTCSTCDDYRFVPSPDDEDVLVECPDCWATPARVCPVHGTKLTGRWCLRCKGEADVAVVLLERIAEQETTKHAEVVAA